MQLGNAFLFIKPVCASPPALFKRGSQTLALAYLIFAPLPSDLLKNGRKNISTVRGHQAQSFCRNIFVQESLCTRTSQVFLTIRGRQEPFFCKTNINVHQGLQGTKPNFSGKKSYILLQLLKRSNI